MRRSPRTGGPRRTLSWVRGVAVGHATDRSVPTGVTAVLFPSTVPTVVDVRGGASGTFDTASLALDATFGGRCALFLSGGSTFGLDAARGIREWVLESGGGSHVFGHPTKIVPLSGAVLFDLPLDGRHPVDYRALGYVAARNASRRSVATGRVGAGAGATVGKLRGRRIAIPGGIGSSARSIESGGRLGVLVAFNSVGGIRDPETGRWLAGARGLPRRGIRSSRSGRKPPAGVVGTTIAVVVTDIPFDRSRLQRLAVAAHDGLARCVQPAHTATDGDEVFVSTTAKGPAPPPESYPGETVDRLSGATSDLVVDAARELFAGRIRSPTLRPSGAARRHEVRE